MLRVFRGWMTRGRASGRRDVLLFSEGRIEEAPDAWDDVTLQVPAVPTTS
jgi:hypothetical protein